MATWRWLRGHVWPCLSGVPLRRYSEITPQLMVGAQIGASGKRYLQRLGVKASINMRIEFDDAAKGLALTEHLWLPTVDGEAPTLDQLWEGVNFIAKVRESGGRVYVHCQSGVGRAPTMAAAYLIATGMPLETAVSTLSRTRPFIDLTTIQQERLREFKGQTNTFAFP